METNQTREQMKHQKNNFQSQTNWLLQHQDNSESQFVSLAIDGSREVMWLLVIKKTNPINSHFKIGV